MIILGIHGGHDASLCIVKDGKLIGAIAIERLTKRKKDEYIYWDEFSLFLDLYDIKLDDVDCIAMGYWNDNFIPFMQIYSPHAEKYPLAIFGRGMMESSITNHLNEYGYRTRVEDVPGVGFSLPPLMDRLRPPFLSEEITDKLTIPINVVIDSYDRVIPGFFVDHQTAHASATYYTSPFERSMIFTADASMHDHQNCSGFFWGEERTLNLFRNTGYMYGNFYDIATEYSGLGPGITKAGTLMGLSSYGQVSKNAIDNWEKWTVPQWMRDKDDSTYIDWLYLQLSGKYPYVGALRPEVANQEPGYHFFSREYQEVYTKEESDSKEVMDIAADIQYIAERSLVKYSNELFKESKGMGDSNLCLAGGTMLNCNANYKIKKESGFENVHLFPACGDDGISVGASLYVAHSKFRFAKPKYSNHELMYLGPEYNTYPRIPHMAKDLDLDVIAKKLTEGKIVCWYQGRSEFGPRALGNRSFITDPRNKEMKDILNSRVKFREWFRPFAPVVLNEHKEEWFEMDFESPFMLHTVPCKKPYDIPSAVHIDNTSRVQTLRKEDNPKFYDLIESFYNLTGVPIVMNTSLNIKGRPIVETPEDAGELFEECDADILVINDVMYFKE